VVQHAARLLALARHAVAFTGAGLSTASGIPDFRSPGSGLWEAQDPMAVASLVAFDRDPAAFFDWIRPLAECMLKAHPNAGHRALARLEQSGVVKAVITQNIDGLHQASGSGCVVELHGNLETATCVDCGIHLNASALWVAALETGQLPRCPTCAGVLRPDVVLYGEALPARTWRQAELHARAADVMLVAGSSLEVWPAAGLPSLTEDRGGQLIIVNREPTPLDSRASAVMHEDVALVLPLLADAVEQTEGHQLR